MGSDASCMLVALMGMRLVFSWTVLPDTDWPNNCQEPYNHGSSAEDCANQCESRADCVATSWNSPNSRPKDGMCNFKCSTHGEHTLTGEEGVIVRKGENRCNVPPPAPSPTIICPHDKVPEDWLQPCLAGQLLFSSETDGKSMPSIGNGYLATVVQSDTIFAAGLFNGPLTADVHRARIPPYKVEVQGVTGSIYAFDLERAVYLVRSNLSSGIAMEERRFAPLQAPNLLVHEIVLTNPTTNKKTVNLRIKPAKASEDLDMHPLDRVLVESSRSEIDIYAVTGSNRVAEIQNKTYVTFAANVPPESFVLAPRSGEISIFVLNVVVTSLNSTNTSMDALTILRKYVDADFGLAKSLYAEHAKAWAKRIEDGHIEIEGDLRLAQAANASLYAIRASIREDWPYGLSPGGLSTNGYDGHTFWDQETWMWPPLLMLDPVCAKSALQYRADRMDGARTKAVNCGMSNHAWCPPSFHEHLAEEAIAFPWESAFTGHEAQMHGGKCGPWCEYEQHISGDIALAVRQYWYATGDRGWLSTIGFPLVNGTASFYAARLQRRSENASEYDYNMVMGPDEYAYPVNNSAYNNAAARIALEFAVEAASVLGHSGAVYEDFAIKASGLALPFAEAVPTRPDLHGGYHPEYMGFPKNPKNPRVKQADTVMLSYPLGVQMDKAVLANDLSFYDGVTDPNGPAMTWAMFAMNWFSVGNFTKSAPNFRRGYANMQWPFGVWAETPQGGCGNFITGAGGFLQTLVFGTSGMRIQHDGLRFDAPPPSATGTGAFRIILHSFHYLGNRLRQEVTANLTRYELLASESGAAALVLKPLRGEEQLLVQGKVFEVTPGVAMIRRAAKAAEIWI